MNDAHQAAPKLGLAITTYNRRDMILSNVADFLRLTSVPFDLVVCDDGSTDQTAEAVRGLGVPVIGGLNRGIAWNKNRGLYYLSQICKCDVIILMDDDVAPVVAGWEQEWINAVQRVGHVNYIPSALTSLLLSPRMDARDIGVSPIIGGMVIAQSALALSYVGYMDIRFGRYGHEHSDFSGCFVRAGFGGFHTQFEGSRNILFYVIDGGVTLLSSTTSGTPTDLDRNAALLGELRDDPVYRAPWRNNVQMREFQRELCDGYLARLRPPVPFGMDFSSEDYLAANGDVAQAKIEPLRHFLRHGLHEHRSYGFRPSEA